MNGHLQSSGKGGQFLSRSPFGVLTSDSSSMFWSSNEGSGAFSAHVGALGSAAGGLVTAAVTAALGLAQSGVVDAAGVAAESLAALEAPAPSNGLYSGTAADACVMDGSSKGAAAGFAPPEANGFSDHSACEPPGERKVGKRK